MSSEMVTREEFGGRDLAVAKPADAGAAALAARSEAEAKSRFVMALSRPRDSAQARHRVLAACKRPRFAEAALFSLPPRGGGKRIEGLSVRAAEEFLRCWGNLQARDEVVHDDADSRIVRVEVIDLETNASFSRDVYVEKRVERKKRRDSDEVIGERTNSDGERIWIIRPTADDLLTKQYALVSKALRTCVLRLIPADVQEDAIDLVRATRENEDAKDPTAATKKLIDRFAEGLGIQPAELSQYLGHPIATATAAEIKELRELGTAISEGHIQWREVLAERAESRSTTGAKVIDVEPSKTSKPPRERITRAMIERQADAPKAEKTLLERVYEIFALDGGSKADADADIKKRWPDGGPTDAQLEAWLAEGCR